MQTSATTEVRLQWSPTSEVPVTHSNLTQTHEAVMRGIAQAARGEGSEIDPRGLPTDDAEE